MPEPKVTPIHDVDQHENKVLENIQTKEELIKFIFQKEFELEVYEAPPGRKERLQKLMDKIMELYPEVDFSTPLKRNQ